MPSKNTESLEDVRTAFISALAGYVITMYRSAQTTAQIAILDRAIEEQKAKMANELAQIRAREAYLVSRIARRRQRFLEVAANPELSGWKIDGVKISTSLPLGLRGYLSNQHSYQSFVRNIALSEVTIPAMPIPFAAVSHLPPDLREIRSGETIGYAFEDDWLIVRKDHAIIVSTDEGALSLHQRMHGDPSIPQTLEVMSKCWEEKQFVYHGSFKPMSRWFPFTQAVTGEIPELFQGWSKDANGLVRFEHLRGNWMYSGNKLVFCVLEHVGFNPDYFSKLTARASSTSSVV